MLFLFFIILQNGEISLHHKIGIIVLSHYRIFLIKNYLILQNVFIMLQNRPGWGTNIEAFEDEMDLMYRKTERQRGTSQHIRNHDRRCY